MSGIITVIDSLPYNADEELVGTSRHHFVTMGELVQAVTEAFDSKRWLTARECLAMLLNPDRFMWKNGDMDDRTFFRDCFFFIIPVHRLHAIGILSEADMNEEKWLEYCENRHIGRKDYIMGLNKNPRNMRLASDSREVPIDRYEVKGKVRCRRRMLLPRDFEERVEGEFPRLDPDLMVVQYQLAPLTSPPAARMAKARELFWWTQAFVKRSQGLRGRLAWGYQWCTRPFLLPLPSHRKRRLGIWKNLIELVRLLASCVLGLEEVQFPAVDSPLLFVK